MTLDKVAVKRTPAKKMLRKRRMKHRQILEVFAGVHGYSLGHIPFLQTGAMLKACNATTMKLISATITPLVLLAQYGPLRYLNGFHRDP